MFRRVLATTAAALVLAGVAAVPAAVPAAASPEDGQGCAGLPDLPAAYVCIISVTPEAALPTVTTSYIPVTVPRVCYVAGCTSATTVQVPVPGATPSSGNVAVLWYQGVHYPIGAGTGAVITPIVNGVVTTATTAVNNALATVNGVISLAGTVADNAYRYAVTTVNNTVTYVNGLVGTVNGLVTTVVGIVDAQADAAIAEAQRIADEAPQAIADFVERELQPVVELVLRVYETLRDLDLNQELQEIVERLQPTLDRLGEIVDNVLRGIRIDA